jgi:hypothetical protein
VSCRTTLVLFADLLQCSGAPFFCVINDEVVKKVLRPLLPEVGNRGLVIGVGCIPYVLGVPPLFFDVVYDCGQELIDPWGAC